MLVANVSLNKTSGFTYLETLISVFCVLIFVTGFQKWMLYSISQKTNIHLQQRLSETSHCITTLLQNSNTNWIQEETFQATPFQYRCLTQDAMSTIPIPLTSANAFLQISLPSDITQLPYSLMISKSTTEYYQTVYILYHVIVFDPANVDHFAISTFIKESLT
jgi:type II secretory pathway pseudopilin PulG